MPFLTEDEYDADDSLALKTDQAKRESAKNVIKTLQNDLSAPKMYLQEIDPESGLPLRKKLVSGGLEYFNDHETQISEDSQYDIDAILSGDISVEDALAGFEHSSSQQEISTPKHAFEESRDWFGELGLDFLKATPVMPSLQVSIRISGAADITVPIACHHIIQTDTLVVLVTDKRTLPVVSDMNFNIDRNTSHSELALPDGTTVPVLPPVPRTVSFELGILRCTLFVRNYRPAHQ